MKKINSRGVQEDKVYNFIKENDGAYVEQIKNGTKMSRAMVQNAICFLLGEDSIKMWQVIGINKDEWKDFLNRNFSGQSNNLPFTARSDFVIQTFYQLNY